MTKIITACLMLALSSGSLLAQVNKSNDIKTKKQVITVPKAKVSALKKNRQKIKATRALQAGPPGTLSIFADNKGSLGKILDHDAYKKYCEKVIVTATDPKGKVYRLKFAKLTRSFKTTYCKSETIEVPSNVPLTLNTVFLASDKYRVRLNKKTVTLSREYPGNSEIIKFGFVDKSVTSSGKITPRISMKNKMKPSRKKIGLSKNIKMPKNMVTVKIWPGSALSDQAPGNPFKNVCRQIKITATPANGKAIPYRNVQWVLNNLVNTGEWCITEPLDMPFNTPIAFSANLQSNDYTIHRPQQEKSFGVSDKDKEVVFNLFRKR